MSTLPLVTVTFFKAVAVFASIFRWPPSFPVDVDLISTTGISAPGPVSRRGARVSTMSFSERLVLSLVIPSFFLTMDSTLPAPKVISESVKVTTVSEPVVISPAVPLLRNSTGAARS